MCLSYVSQLTMCSCFLVQNEKDVCLQCGRDYNLSPLFCLCINSCFFTRLNGKNVIHPSIHFLYPINPSVGLRGGWSLSQRSSGERRGTPWTGRQSITETNETNNHTRSHSLLRTILESPISLTCMFLDGGRKPEYPERTHAYTGRTCKLHTERPQVGIEPGTLSL